MLYRIPADRTGRWDLRFLRLARHVSEWSRDPSTKMGAVIVRPDKSVASIGFNGFPQKMPDDETLYEIREEKYSRIIHCEMNAAMFCRDETLRGYTLYTWPLMPCERCFVHVAQMGIVRCVFPKATPEAEARWSSAFAKTVTFANEMGDIDLVEIRGFIHT